MSLTFGNDYGQDSGTSLALSAISASSNRAGRCSVAALPKSAMSQLVTGWSHWLHLASRSLVGVSFCCAGEGGGVHVDYTISQDCMSVSAMTLLNNTASGGCQGVCAL